MATDDQSKDKPAPTDGQTTEPEAAERPDETRLGIELGVDSNLPFATPFNPVALGVGKTRDEELREILKDESEEYGPTVRQLIAMRRMDGQARALYRLLTLPIRAALQSCTFVPAEGGEKEAEFIEQVFTTPPESGGMTVTLHRFMSQLLMGLFDGFSAFEKVFWIPDHGPLEGKVTMKKLAHRPPETITFVTDKTGGFAGLRQRAQNAGKIVDVFIEPEYSLYYAAQEEERKFYGVSFFQSAFYHYDKKVKMYYIAHLSGQRAAIGTRIGTHPRSATRAERANFAQQLQNMSLAQWMMAPEDFKVDSLKESGSFPFLEYINHHNSQMSKSLLAAFFDSDAGGKTSESTPLIQNNQPGDEMFKLMLSSIMDDIANQINHYIIPQLVDYNFDGGKYPTFTWGKLTDEQKGAIAETFDKLASQQTVTPEFIRALEEHQAEEFGLDIDYDEIEEREAQEAAMMQQQAGQQVDENGNPIPQVGENGNPVDTAAATPAGAAASGQATNLASFGQQAVGLTNPAEDDEVPGGTTSLMKLARELLDAAEEQDEDE